MVNLISEKMNEAIDRSIENIEKLNEGSDAKKTEAETLKVLCDIKRENERLEEDKKDSRRKLIIAGVTIGVNAALFIGELALHRVNFIGGLKFEETGSVRSAFVRSLINAKCTKPNV